MERARSNSVETPGERAGSTLAGAAELAWLSTATPPEARALVLIGAGSGAGLGALLGERAHLSVVVLEPDPRAADALRSLSGRALSAVASRITILSGPNYLDAAGHAGSIGGLINAPVVVHPTLERRHPREVARARGLAARLALDAPRDSSTVPTVIDRRQRMPTSARAAAVELGGVRVLSVDAFDTLLLRSVAEPRDLFRHLGERARAQGLVDAHIDASRFQHLRQSAERAARDLRRTAAGTSEVGLRDIYDAWPGGRVEAGRLAALELEVEAEFIYAHPLTLALVNDARARGIQTALVSDTYFSREELSGLLVAAGVSPRLFDVILSSADAGCSKHEGRLFDRLLAHWPDITPGACLHVGDHPHADVRQAARAGLRTAEHDTGRTGPVADALRLEAVRYGDVLPEIASLRAIAGTIERPGAEDAAWYFALGASVFGPALSAFADWVVTESVRDGFRVVRPLMREGALFAELISQAAAVRGATIDVEPLFVSRSATWLASLDQLDRAAIHRLLQRQHLTIAEALRVLDLDGHPGLSRLARFADTTIGAAGGIEVGPRTTLTDLFVECLEQPAVRDHVGRAIHEARARLAGYLLAACGSGREVALVDLGFHCTIGRAIERVMAGARPAGFHHLLLFGSETLTRLWTAGSDVRVFGAGPIESLDLAGPIVRHPALLEALFIDGGTTLGYERRGSSVAPVVDENRASLAQQQAAADCRRGIRRFQECWLDWSVTRPALARRVASDRRGLSAPIHRLLTMPTTAEVAMLGHFVHEDNDGGRSMRPLTEPGALAPDVTPDAFLRAASSGAAAFGRTWLWPAGACESRWPGFIEARWRDASGTVDGTPPLMPAIASRMRQDGVRECLVWGAGEAGSALIRAIRREGIAVLFATDSNPSHWGTAIDGVPVVAPAEACRQGNHTFAIGSCAFAHEIEQALREHYERTATAVRIFSPLAEAA